MYANYSLSFPTNTEENALFIILFCFKSHKAPLKTNNWINLITNISENLIYYKLLGRSTAIFFHKYYLLIIISCSQFFFFLPISVIFCGLYSNRGSAQSKSRALELRSANLRVEICRETELCLLIFLQTPTSVTIAKGLSAFPKGCFQRFTPCCRLKLGKQACMPEGIYCLTCLNINMIKQKLDDFINHNLIKGWLVIFMFQNNSLLHLVQQKGVFAAQGSFAFVQSTFSF